MLANLAGFDGSPESMRGWQLEYGAEIGRAVVNFDGPDRLLRRLALPRRRVRRLLAAKLNDNLEAVALEGAHASVIGGAPAAAVVFARDVEQAARRDERIVALDERIAAAEGAERQRLRAERDALWSDVRAEKRGEFAAEFDAVHSVERAVRMGSVSRIVAPASLRAVPDRRRRARHAPERIEILAAPDGAPEVWVSGERAAVSLSLSHRAGRALAVVAPAPAVVGCDLEVVEPRSGAFVREWLSAPEQALVAGLADVARDRTVNGLWTAKEAVAKVRREGLRLDVRHAVVDASPPGPGWRPLRVRWEGCSTAGWWREEPGWVMAVAGEPAPAQPRPL